MKRRLVNLVTALSLLLSAAGVALWVRSYWRHDDVSASTLHGAFWRVSSSDGRLSACFRTPGREDLPLAWRSCPPLMQSTTRFVITHPPGRRYPVRAHFAAARVGYWHGQGELIDWGRCEPLPELGLVRYGGVYFPHWLAACAAGLPGISVVTRRGVRRWRKRHRGVLCVCCGYDLRATPDRCPECGTIPAAPPAT